MAAIPSGGAFGAVIQATSPSGGGLGSGSPVTGVRSSTGRTGPGPPGAPAPKNKPGVAYKGEPGKERREKWPPPNSAWRLLIGVGEEGERVKSGRPQK